MNNSANMRNSPASEGKTWRKEKEARRQIEVWGRGGQGKNIASGDDCEDMVEAPAVEQKVGPRRQDATIDDGGRARLVSAKAKIGQPGRSGIGLPGSRPADFVIIAKRRSKICASIPATTPNLRRGEEGQERWVRMASAQIRSKSETQRTRDGKGTQPARGWTSASQKATKRMARRPWFATCT
eukprot:6192292-Pleurochrysis_carterae.AAC.4